MVADCLPVLLASGDDGVVAAAHAGWRGLAGGIIGRALNGLLESILNRLPVIRSLYGAIKQIMETVLANKSAAFRECVLIEYPRKGIWTLGFITGATKGEVQERAAEQLINVFVPTTPNPTSGFLLFVPERDIVRLKMRTEDGLKLVVSGGIVTPTIEATALPASQTSGS